MACELQEELATATAQPGSPIAVEVDESFTLGDTPVPAPPAVVTINESFTLGDAPVPLPPTVVIVNEAFSLGDMPVSLPSVVVIVNEAFSLGDTSVPLPPAVVIVNEAFSLGDTSVPLPPTVVIVNESFSLGDAPVPLPPAVVIINESFSLGDASVPLPPTVVIVNESFSLDDSLEGDSSDDQNSRGSPPVFEPIPTGGKDVKAEEQFKLILLFSDEDADDMHRATVDWGDGTIEGAYVDQDKDAVLTSHVYQIGGSYTVTITITDSRGLSDSVTFEIRAHTRPTEEDSQSGSDGDGKPGK